MIIASVDARAQDSGLPSPQAPGSDNGWVNFSPPSDPLPQIPADALPFPLTRDLSPATAGKGGPNLDFPIVDANVDFSTFVDATADSSASPTPGQVAILKTPWWNQDQASMDSLTGRAWDLSELIWLAIENSPLVQSVLIEPQVLQARAVTTQGIFDAETFLESIFNDTSDPVGNTLVAGTPTRLNDHFWENKSGIRKKNIRGGQAELTQEFLFKDSNSDFFIPRNQSDTKMVMRYTQPILRGGGESYNQSSFVVASLAANASFYDASLQIQEHAFLITNTYWELFAARSFQAQIQRGMERLQKLRNTLAGRTDIDSLRSQLWRADAAIARQQAALARAIAQIQSSEANLRSAVAAPELLENRAVALVPATLTSDWPSDLSPVRELSSALNQHPEVQALQVQLKSARVRMQVAEHELRPTLDLLLEGYVRGLNGDFDAAKSFGDQFSTGAPSYSAGLAYSSPYRNTAAKAILRERRLELRRTLLELDHTLLKVGANVEGAIADVAAAYAQLESSVQSTLATHSEIENLVARLKNPYLETTLTSLLLDQLLDAELQLIQAENTWARAQADHMIALARLQLSTGSLLPIVDMN